MRSSRLLRWLNRTPVQTFILCPLLVFAFELVRQRAQLTIVPAGFALLAWGYLQYLLVGRFRSRVGGGGPGFGVPPDRIVEDGPYRYVRNPMYLGHLIFMLGLAVAVPTATGGCLPTIPRAEKYSSGTNLTSPQVAKSPILRLAPFSSGPAADQRSKNSCASSER